MVKHQNRLPRDVESPSLERVKIHSEEPVMADFLSKKVGLDTSSSPLQPQLSFFEDYSKNVTEI